MRKFKVVVNGREYDVEVVEVSETAEPAANAGQHPVAAVGTDGVGVAAAGPGVPQRVAPAPTPVLMPAPEPAPKPATAPPAVPAAAGAGGAMPSGAPAVRAGALPDASVKKVEAPLAGTILSVRAAEGDRVKVGDVLVTLEALKLENEIASPHSGVVRSVNVKPGDSVHAGALLVTVEETGS